MLESLNTILERKRVYTAVREKENQLEMEIRQQFTRWNCTNQYHRYNLQANIHEQPKEGSIIDLIQYI